MKNILSINEFFINKQNSEYLIGKLIESISNNFDDIHVVKNDKLKNGNIMYYHLQIYPVKPKQISSIEKLLNLFITIFEKNELYFYFTSKGYADNGMLTYIYDCYIKNEKLQRVKPPQFVYHVSDRKIWTVIDTEKIPNKWYLDLNINKYMGHNHSDYLMSFEHIPFK